MGAPAISFLGELPKRMDVAEILPSIGVHDDGGLDRRGIGVVPEEEFLPVAPECDFYEVGHFLNLAACLLCPLPQSEESLSAAAHELFRPKLPKLLDVPVE